MSDPAAKLPGLARFYVGFVIAIGAATIVLSCVTLRAHWPGPDLLTIAALTIISSFMPVRLHKVIASISVAETFVFAATLLFGPAAGTILVCLDALLIWIQLTRQRGATWYRIVFSMAASALSMWAAGNLFFAVLRVPALSALTAAARPPIWRFAVGLVAFTAVYFLLNSWLVAIAIALEQREHALRLWSRRFLPTAVPNYLTPASLAALLVFNSYGIRVALAFILLPMFVLLMALKRFEAHVEETKRKFLQTIETLAMAIDAKDQVTHGHIRRVQRNAMALAAELGIRDEDMLDALRAAALLHDTGKLHVPDHILNKPGKLTPTEFDQMKLHAAIGADILKRAEFPYPVEPMVRHHHERWDGGGYPSGLQGEEIPLGARILSVVDCYDAVTSDRPYRMRMTRTQAEQVLRENRGTAYDPAVVDAFIRILDRIDHVDTLERVAAPPPAPSAGPWPDRPVESSASAERLLQRVRPLVPATTHVAYAPSGQASELMVAACSGAGAREIGHLRITIGQRMAGWVFANKRAIVNSEAALDLGALARSTEPPLEYAMVVPILDAGECVAVVGLYGPAPFTDDQQHALDAATTGTRL